MSYLHIGKNFTPPDIHGKVTGKARYAEDYAVDGMVYARLYTSPMPHARVVGIDADEALAMEGVLGILTAEDVYPTEAPAPALLTNEPVYVGDPILAIAAVDEKTAENALGKIRVRLEPLPFAVDPVDSLRPGGPSARLEGNVYPREMQRLSWSAEDVERFVSGREPTGPAPTEWSYGDLEAGFDNAALILEESFVTTGYAHMSMEPRSVLSYWQNGKCHVYGSTQSQSFVVPFLAQMLGIEQKDLVYVSEYCGGGFGSKIAAYPVLAIPGYFSKKLGRPVMLRITREEEYYVGSARVGFQGWIKAGFTKEGRVSAVDLYIVQDLGSQQAGGDASSAGGAISILYQPDAMRLRDVPVLTNTTPRGPQRGPGQNQIAAIFEPMLDKAARELGIDPLDIRRLNAPDSSATLNANQGPVTSVYMREALDMGAELFGWSERIKKSGRRNGSKVTGIGVGQGYHSAGANGFDGLVRITPDGRIHLHSGVGNLGTYSYAATTRAAAEALRCNWESCVIHHGNTEAHLPWSSYQAGSNTTFTHTRANYVAAEDAIRKMKLIAAEVLGGTPEQYDIADERVFDTKNAARSLTYGEVAAKAIELGGEFSGQTWPDDIHEVTQRAVQGIAGTGLVGVAKDNLPVRGTVPGLTVGFIEIELDLETGKHEIVDFLAVAECGTVLHPLGLAGQLRGGAVWGFGMAGLERHVYDPQNGLPANVGYYQTRPPSYLDVPGHMEWSAVDMADPDNPVGARGVGEPAMGSATAALMCALSDALGGHLFNRTPVTPDVIVNHVAGLGQSYGPLSINTF
ncbi:MAG: xanthine dehydrogenase family protein molybdopterin-binding subunit [Pseudomonadales bacterium]